MATFRAGVGSREITPAAGLPMWGYSDRAGPAEGTLDPLYARAIVFEDGERRAAWVVLDLGRVPLAVDCNVVRERVAGLGLDAVVFHGTHTHHGPAVEVMSEGEKGPMLGAMAAAIEEAVETVEPARIGVGTCTLDMAHNRRRITEDGRCVMRWRNVERRATSPVDPEATVIRLDREAGGPLAVLVHFACHPVVIGPSNLGYSADYPGTLTRIVKGMTDAECFFLQGGCGDINPYLDKTPVEEGGIEAAFSTGRIAAETVLPVYHTISPLRPAAASVRLHQSTVPVGVRWDLTDARQREVLREAHRGLFEHYLQGADPNLAVPYTVLVLNRELGLIGMPGEFYVEHQLALKRNSLLRHGLLCGFVDDYHGYFPPVHHAAAGGYGGMTGAYVGLGAAEKVLLRAEIGLHTLAGRFKERYGREDFVVHEDEDLTGG